MIGGIGTGLGTKKAVKKKVEFVGTGGSTPSGINPSSAVAVVSAARAGGRKPMKKSYYVRKKDRTGGAAAAMPMKKRIKGGDKSGERFGKKGGSKDTDDSKDRPGAVFPPGLLSGIQLRKK